MLCMPRNSDVAMSLVPPTIRFAYDGVGTCQDQYKSAIYEPPDDVKYARYSMR